MQRALQQAEQFNKDATLSPGDCHCLEMSGPTTTSTPLSNLLRVGENENRIPGHTRDCSLRSVSPLLDLDLINRKLLPTDSADTAIAQQFARRYELLRKENESLRQTVIQQEAQIEKLQSLIKSIQFDGYSSESRYDKSSSSNSNIPTLRVTPQKRSSTSSSTQTPRSPRSGGRRASRRLLFPESSESETTPTQRSTTLRTHQLGVNASHRAVVATEPRSEPRSFTRPTHRSLEILGNEQTSPFRGAQRRNIHPVAVSRTISSHDLTSQFTMSPARSNRPASGPPRFADANDNIVEPPTGNALPNLAFYLQRFRPDFLRESERRQQIIRQVAARRANIEAARKEIAINIINGGKLNKLQEEILKADTTRITAFPTKEMQAWTKKRLATTNEYLRKVEEKESDIDRRANRFLAAVHSQRTKTRAI